MIHKNDANDRILQKESKIGRAHSRNNIGHKKAVKAAQENEYKSLNNYGEGFCYGCNVIDRVLQSVFYICTACYRKRGKEGLFANVILKETEELCDICGYWKFGVWQRNVAFCMKCIDRVEHIHAKYNKTGGMTPFEKGMRKRHGKDYKTVLTEGM